MTVRKSIRRMNVSLNKPHFDALERWSAGRKVSLTEGIEALIEYVCGTTDEQLRKYVRLKKEQKRLEK